jgi:hypothetical protein
VRSLVGIHENDALSGNFAVNVLLLTATIRPPADAINLARQDVGLRLQDYICALNFYIDQIEKKVIDKIVFCDNSNFDPCQLHALVSQRVQGANVEIISFAGLDYPAANGRGFGEFMLVDYAMEHSKLLASAPCTVWKVTGRYKVLNLNKLIRSRPTSAQLYCNSRNYPDRWTDLYVLAWTQVGYEKFIKGVYKRLSEDGAKRSAEHLFRIILDGNKNSKKELVERFKVVPLLDGIRGVDNGSYLSMNLKYRVRAMARIFMPWFWV